MDHVLIVEDSPTFAAMLMKKIYNELPLECDLAGSKQEAEVLIESNPKKYLVALLDLHLPDSHEGELVDYAVAHGLPAIVMTGQFSDEIRERILKTRILDYIIKSGEHSLDLLVHAIKRLAKNRFIKVMVVDDSVSTRMMIRRLLQIQKFIIVEAKNGEEALQVWAKHPDIQLVITDYNMPVMDGFELTSKIRLKAAKDELIIIGISATDSSSLSARFLKNGANDFIKKPFVIEEFYWRINQNIEMLENIKALKDAAIQDYLTGLFNRRYFFGKGSEIYNDAKSDTIPIAVAMMDIDFFKKVNDTYGHEGGDEALLKISALIKNTFHDDIAARLGGEEFCVLCVGVDAKAAREKLEVFRVRVEAATIVSGDNKFSMTVSTGLYTGEADNLEEAVKKADLLLYQAKESGRNCIKESA